MIELDAEQWLALSTSPAAYAFAALFGALWGSFGNVCIYRMPPSDEHPRGRSVVAPGSHCFACGAAVRWYDNVPLLSFLWLRGRCRDCKAEFSPRYLLVEAASAMLFAAAYYYVVAIVMVDARPGAQLLQVGVLWAFLWTLLVITFIDLDHQLILDKLTYPAIPIFYGLGMLLPDAEWQRGLIGMAVGYGLIRAISDGFYYLTKREGMGYGDGKLLAIIGALYGWQGVFVSLFLGSLLGSIISIAILLVTGTREEELEPATTAASSLEQGPADQDGTSELGGANDEQEVEENLSSRQRLGRVAVPFGPFLAMAAVIYVFTESYLRLRFFTLWD